MYETARGWWWTLKSFTNFQQPNKRYANIVSVGHIPNLFKSFKFQKIDFERASTCNWCSIEPGQNWCSEGWRCSQATESTDNFQRKKLPLQNRWKPRSCAYNLLPVFDRILFRAALQTHNSGLWVTRSSLGMREIRGHLFDGRHSHNKTRNINYFRHV